MARETQKAKIERLEKEVRSLTETIQKLNNEIEVMQDNADKNFNNSADYIQMKKQIKDLKLKLKVSEDSKEHNRKMYESELKKNDEIIKEFQKLKNENERLKKNSISKRHNERGAGRKTRFTNTEIETIKMYRLQNKTIKEIAEIFDCSVGLIHKIVKGK